MRREDRPPSRFILSQTSAGNDCWGYVISGSSSVQFLGSCHEAVPSSRPALVRGRRADGAVESLAARAQIGKAMGAPGSLCFWPFSVDSDLDPVRRKRAISIIRLRAGLLR